MLLTMIYAVFFVSILACFSAKMTPEFSSTPHSNNQSSFQSNQSSSNLNQSSQVTPKSQECKITTNITAQLDLAGQIIKNVRDSNCGCPRDDALPSDCEEVLRGGQTSSGVYKVQPRSRVLQNPIEVYCDMTTDKGGWTVIQRRGNFNRSADYFYKSWQFYKIGFGNVDKDFWLGNDNIFALSNQKLYSVRFDLKDVEGNRAYAEYDTFWIDDENHKYMLHIDGYSGDAGDSMIPEQNGMKFSTKDQKNDNNVKSCAQEFKGGWWYNKCHQSNLNGLYHKGKHESFADGVNWFTWKKYHESLEWTEIKIRGKGFRQ